MPVPDIVLLRDQPIASDVLGELVARFFEDMVKYVVDIERSVAAVGGELHADAEALRLEDGSQQRDLCGANYYTGTGPDECIEYMSLINISPSREDRSMLIEDEAIRKRVRDITARLIGSGDPLP